MSDQLTLKVGGVKLSGWTEIAVTRGIEQAPNSFAIAATEASPVASDARMVAEGQPCTVSLGADLVLTGYVDEVISGFGAGEHAVQIVGRGKCADLVDCSAEWPSQQISSAPVLDIATKLAKPYGISVRNLGPAGQPVPQFNISIGETPAEIIELVTRHAALLWYEDPQGNLVLNQVGATKAGSGFVEGQNLQACSIRRSMAARYSDYVCALLNINTSGIALDQNLYYFTATDPNVPRHRKIYIVAEGVPGGSFLAALRAKWEAARRAGRAKAVTVTTDSWRDAKGKLWEPNTLAPISCPRLKIKEAGLCISQVTYRLGAKGRTADLLLMPKEAFLPEPIQLQPQVFGLTLPQPAATTTPGG